MTNRLQTNRAQGDQVKVKVRELLTDESTWTKGYEARDRRGKPCEAHSLTASQFCLVGAVIRVSCGEEDYAQKIDKLTAAVCTVAGRRIQIEEFNDLDTTCYEDIVKVLKLADV